MQKLNKPINTDSLRPSSKPMVTYKSNNFEYKRQMLTTNNSEKKNYTNFDTINERQSPSINFSNFHKNHIYSSNKDLADSFSFSEDDEQYEK